MSSSRDRVPRFLAALGAGALFGAGLALSGMIDPTRVLGFLDMAGDWDPRLAFVMAGALVVFGIGYRFALRRSRPVWDTQFHLPKASAIDPRLVGGAILFGIGWGLAGLCPGPAIAGLATGYGEIWLFVIAMIAGMAIHAAVVRNK